MKAMTFPPFGGLSQLAPAEIPPPIPAPGQMLVEVVATSINPIDWKLRQGAPRGLGPLLPAVPCFDFAGVVKQVAGDFAAGERVFGMMPIRAGGAACEIIAVEPRRAARIPENLRFEEAAGLPLAGMTALQALRNLAKLKPGQRLLIVGAAGGVGHYAVQLGRAMNARVTGVCSGRDAAFVRELGADAVLDRTLPGFSLPAGAFDVVFDAAAALPPGAWRRALAGGGVYVSTLWTPGLLLRRLAGQRIGVVVVKPRRADLECLANLARQGLLRTAVERVYALNDLAAALEHSREGHTRGKRVVLINA